MNFCPSNSEFLNGIGIKAHPQAPVTAVRTEPEKRKARTRSNGAERNSRKTGRKQISTRQNTMKTIDEQRHGIRTSNKQI
jgi:hypothetical protein